MTVDKIVLVELAKFQYKSITSSSATDYKIAIHWSTVKICKSIWRIGRLLHLDRHHHLLQVFWRATGFAQRSKVVDERGEF